MTVTPEVDTCRVRALPPQGPAGRRTAEHVVRNTQNVPRAFRRNHVEQFRASIAAIKVSLAPGNVPIPRSQGTL